MLTTGVRVVCRRWNSTSRSGRRSVTRVHTDYWCAGGVSQVEQHFNKRPLKASRVYILTTGVRVVCRRWNSF